MSTVVKWGIEDITQTEEEGVVVSLTTKYLVYDLSNTNGDNRTLDEALNASGLPVEGDKAPGNTNLALSTRTVEMLPGSPTKARVTCQYKTVADFADSFIFSGGTSLNQTQTDVDIYGNRISLSYTYPATYPVAELQSTTYTTAINESVYVPRTTLTATGTLLVDYPTQISHGWVWHMNSTFWAGWPAGYWMCTGCDFTPRDVGVGRTHKWRFTWTFELEPRGWPVYAKIIDPNTGNVPADVVDNVGVKYVEWYPSRDFNELFGNT